MQATTALMKALRCEQTGHLLEAHHLYGESVELLRHAVSKETRPTKQEILRNHLQDSLTHRQKLNLQLETNLLQRKLLQHILIAEGSRGHSYRALFGRYLNGAVKEVQLFEPCMTSRAHVQNLVNFLELCVKKCGQLRYIRLITKKDTRLPKNQQQLLDQIRLDLEHSKATLNYQFERKLLERKIVLSNGIVIKMERGLHYYRQNEPPVSLGLSDFDFRRCMRTEVEIWGTPPFEQITKE